MWNLQSGIRRKTFDYQASTSLRTIDPEQRGEKTVTGIASDSLNKTLIVSTLAGSLHVSPINHCVLLCSFDGVGKQFFDMHTTQLQHSVSLSTGVTAILLNRDNNLLAVTCDDMTVRIVDIESRRTVRELSAFRGRILDLVCAFAIRDGYKLTDE